MRKTENRSVEEICNEWVKEAYIDVQTLADGSLKYGIVDGKGFDSIDEMMDSMFTEISETKALAVIRTLGLTPSVSAEFPMFICFATEEHHRLEKLGLI